MAKPEAPHRRRIGKQTMRAMFAAAAAAGTLAIAAPAAAATSFSFDMGPNGGSYDTALVTLTNTSDLASLVSFSIDFAPSPANIDRASSFTRLNDGGANISWTVVSPDTSDNGVRADWLRMTFTGFEARNADEALRFHIDFDPDTGNASNQDFRNILFNNGALNNAVLTVGFSDGVTLSQTLGDGAPQASYHFTGSTAAVPEPATWALMIMGFGGAGATLRRRRGLLATA
jgi:hypothetical protein